MKVGIIGAMEEEVAILRNKLEEREETETAHSHFYSGRINGIETVLLQSGIGKVNAALGTTLMIDRYHPDVVINTGSAGGTDLSLTIGDVVISSGVVHHDVDATAFGYKNGQVPGMPAVYRPDPDLSQLAKRCAERALSGHRIVSGMIGTGDSFMNDPERIRRIKAWFPDLKALEMEGAAIAQVCYQFGTPFLIIRALSDIAGKESGITFDQFLKTAAGNSAGFLLDLLKELKHRDSTKDQNEERHRNK
ncbi:5'-methylthioadenosine/S-adenosylhomocysteine nucleosidase [Sporolactobacillus vineae]|uniref:5'-methylthioadenosine/S-adenosylhomocysteine nucleosidase n=1 Tax=Sporolactobacillus vineae TaxID=444463 RepID=UPI000288C546|nr:5'-methylthioadenosine/S-adenosylhomocysteine nucleosidase [Sporolactobacillus vineae]